MKLAIAVALVILVLQQASAFTSVITGLTLRSASLGQATSTAPRLARRAALALSMQQDAPKQTTGFGKMFSGLKEALNEDTTVIDPDTGKRTMKANNVQIMLMISAQFGIPILLINIYKAIKGV